MRKIIGLTAHPAAGKGRISEHIQGAPWNISALKDAF